MRVAAISHEEAACRKVRMAISKAISTRSMIVVATHRVADEWFTSTLSMPT